VVQLSFTALPEVPARNLSITGSSLGVPFLTALKEKRVHVSPSEGWASQRLLGSVESSHALDYGAARRFSQPLSDFFLSPPSCHFQTGDALRIPPFRGFILS
jgi:hypothetical protein